MPEQSLSFDFNKAVADARRDYPDAVQNVTFVDLDDPDSMAQIAWWVTMRSEKTRILLDKAASLAQMNPESYGFAFKDPWGGEKIIAVHTRPQKNLDLLQNQPQKQAAYVFLHELGHLVVPMKERDSNPGENGADAFAMIEGLRRGILDVADVQQVANARVGAFLSDSDLVHLTTASLDYIAVNPEGVDFSKLTPQDVANRAHAYAEDLANTKEDDKQLGIVNAKMGGKKPEWDDIMLRLSSLAIVAKADSATFYIAARVIDSAFKTGLIDESAKIRYRDGAGAQKETDGPPYWDKVKDAIRQKIELMQPNAKKLLETLAPPPARADGPAV